MPMKAVINNVFLRNTMPLVLDSVILATYLSEVVRLLQFHGIEEKDIEVRVTIMSADGG